MKKSLLVLAALTAFAGVASAQSSVTAFGIVDLAARNVKNGNAGSIKSLSPNGQATSRLGFRGVEDLGGGLRAGFWLESEVAPDTGGAGSTVAGVNVFWARRATVSLIGSFGEIRLGRDLNVSYTSLGAFDPFGYVGVASIANVRGTFLGLGGATTGVRTSNTITYYLPAMGGLYGGLMVGAGEGGTGNKYIGGRLGYAAGPLNVSAASAKTYKTGTMIDDLTTMNFGASFNLGFATIGGAYEKSEYSTQDNKLTTVYTTVPMGPGVFKAQYTKSSGTGPVGRADAYDATQFGIGYVYSMSKRTSLYTNYGSINNGGTGTSATVGSGATYTATGAGPAGMNRGATSTGYEFGVRHDF
jgi:predicted porin